MKITLLILITFQSSFLFGQITYETPTPNSVPDKLAGMRRGIDVINFPKTNDPIKIKDTYHWKHMTSILCKESRLTIVEYGAYLFYNGTWNLRKSYSVKEFDKNFESKKGELLQSQPYTWTNNWRTGDTLFGGWALWYFIGKTKSGELICGYETINTTNNLLKTN